MFHVTTPTVAIIICTRDRADSLRETLVSIGRCAVPPDIAAELLVVDNGSTDHTAAVVAAAGLRNLPVRRVLEATPGLSRARNAGLRATTADVVLFTDDDVRVPEHWIEGMCRPIFSGRAAAVAGGVHLPAHYEPALAQEPFRSRRGWFAANGDVDPDRPNHMVGANMAFSRRVIEALEGFDPQLGAGALGFHEEALFSWRLREAGFRLVTALDTSVEHHFDLSRLTRRTLLHMAERMGRSEAYVSYHWHQDEAPAGPAKVWRARLLLLAARLAAPWHALANHAPVWEMQRVQTLAYWRQLARLRGTPRHYRRAAATPQTAIHRAISSLHA